MTAPLGTLTDPDDPGDVIVRRASVGARLLTARGIGMRVVSIASNLALVALVSPSDLGLLAVVRGLAALTGNTTDLGFAWALLRRTRDPSKAEYAALAGLQLAMVSILVGVVALRPELLDFAAVPEQWRWWVVGLLAVTILVPFGTGSKIRIERRLDYRKVAFIDVTSVLLLNVGLLGFAAANAFAVGIFVATGASIAYINLMVMIWSPGPRPSFKLAMWRSLAREFAGFSVGHICYVLFSSATPIVVANLFGLGGAGIWAFATRIGNVLQVAFEGFRRAAIPAAAKLVAYPASLRRLAEDSLLGAARLTVPMVAAVIVSLPVVGLVWPKWGPAVVPAQIYALGFALSGMLVAAVMPVAVVLRGASAVIGEQLSPMVVGWLGFLAVAPLGVSALGWVILPMYAALAVTVWGMTDRSVRPRWQPPLGGLTVSLAVAMAITVGGRLAGAAVLPTAAISATTFGAIWLVDQRLRSMLLAAVRWPGSQPL